MSVSDLKRIAVALPLPKSRLGRFGAKAGAVVLALLALDALVLVAVTALGLDAMVPHR